MTLIKENRKFFKIDPYYRVRNQEFFRAGEFSWNYGTLINIHLQQNKEKLRREKSPIFCPEILKNCIVNEKFYP